MGTAAPWCTCVGDRAAMGKDCPIPLLAEVGEIEF